MEVEEEGLGLFGCFVDVDVDVDLNDSASSAFECRRNSLE